MTLSQAIAALHRAGVRRFRARAALLSCLVLLCGTAVLLATPGHGRAFLYGGLSGGPLAGTLTVTVVDGASGLPVSGAWVLVGPEAGSPFEGNYGQTGGGGQIVFTDGSLFSPQTVTAAKEGYRVITIVDVNASQATLPLELFTAYDPADPPVDTGVIVQGTVTNFTTSGNVDVAIVRDPVDQDWVMDFDVERLFGPAVVEYLTPSGYEGYYDLPRNVYMPVQAIGGGQIQRTPYMLRLPEGSTQRLFVMKGNVGLLALVQVLESGSIGPLLGALTYNQFGLDTAFTVTGPGPINRDVNLNLGLAFSFYFNVSNLPPVPYGWPFGSAKRPFLVALADLDKLQGRGRMVPMNLRLMASSWAGGNQIVGVPRRTLPGDPMNLSDYHGLVAVSAFDASDNPVPRLGLSSMFHRYPMSQGNDGGIFGTGDPMPFNSFFPFISFTGSQLMFPGDRILQFYWAWDEEQEGVDYTRCDLDLVAQVACNPEVGECPVGRVREYRDTNWTVIVPGTRTGFNLPALPPGAPRALSVPAGEPGVAYTLDWKIAQYGLFHNGHVFDYDAFAFSDHGLYVNRVTQRSTYIPNLPNRAPDPPRNLSPADGQSGLSRTPALAASTFNDQDAASTHAASRWQVSAAPAVNGEYASPVFDSGEDSGNLEMLAVPAGVLGVGTYYWHVRYRDDGGKWSAYSAETSFTTAGCSVNEDCDDGDVCNGPETCVSGACQAGTPLVCDDGNVCTDDTCDPVAGCVTVNNTAPCDDGNACTTNDTCSGGACVGGPALACDDGDACNGTETCDPVLGCLAGTPLVCDDGVFCNGAEWCHPDTGCQPGIPPDCDDGVFCNGVETCDPGLDRCVSPGNPCPDDGIFCNGSESCDELLARCVSSGNPCTVEDECTEGVCIEAQGTCEVRCTASGLEDPCCLDPVCAGARVCRKLQGMPWLHMLLLEDE